MQNAKQDAAILRGRKILIVEDEALLAYELEVLLGSHGGLIIGPAVTVTQALHLVEAARPDLAVLDRNINGAAATPVAAALSARAVRSSS